MVASALGSLVFDCEVTNTQDPSTHGNSAALVPEVESVVQRLELLARTTVPFARELRNCVQRRQMIARGEDIHSLGRYLVSQGYAVSLRAALPGQGSDCFKSLRHEFLVVAGAGEFAGMEFLVEPALRQHFTIPHPSRDYAFALSRVPDVFVGGSCRLAPLVQLLCALMADSFAAQGLALPPWRREAAMLSKWLPLPNRTRDTPIAAPAAKELLPMSISLSMAPMALSPPSDAGKPMRVINVPDFGRTDSSTSNVSASDCGGMCSIGGSPLVADLLQPPLPYTPAAAPIPNGGGGIGKFWAVHGFTPAALAAGGEDAAVTVSAAADTAAAAATAAAVGAVSDSEAGIGVSPLVCGSAASGSSVSGKSPGLLAAKLQQRRDDGVSAAAAAAAAAGGGGCDGPAAALIRTRAPVHPGEMAIRVVKLVGFALPSARQPPTSPPLPPLLSSQQQQQCQHQTPAVPPPAAAAAGAASEPSSSSSPRRPGLVPWRLSGVTRSRVA